MHSSQQYLQAVLDTAVDGIITIDEAGIIESANAAAARLFGYQPDALIGSNVAMLMPPADGNRHVGYIARYVNTGEAHVIGKGRELVAKRRDGSVFPIELSVSAVPGDDGRHFTGIVRDVSARKKADEALRESRAKIQAVLDTAVDAILTIDDQGTIESANPATGRLFGYAVQDLIGRNVSVLMTASDRSKHDAHIRRYLKTGEARVVGIGREVMALRCDGSTFPAELAVSEVRYGDQRRFTGIIRDISLRKQAEEALLRANALKDEFLANTSHELRTPLNGIIGIGQSMLDGATGSLTEDQQRNLAMIVASGRRLGNLVNDLLDFSTLRHETIELRRRPTDLHALTNLVLAISRTLISRPSLRLFNRIDPQVPLVEIDEDRVQQILFNLVGNAIKFTPAGAVEVSAALDGQWLLVSVADTGVGIPPDQLGPIFEMFSQGDGSIAREQGGTGLGLAITRQLVELHGGLIKVESEVGAGSRFTFSLPLSQARRELLTIGSRPDALIGRVLPDVELAAKPATAEKQLRAGSGHRILVVDDEPVNVQSLVNFLTLAKYEVVTATDGQEALAYLFSDQPCDLVLLDVMMPRFSGFDVCQRIRERFSPADLPIVLLTAKNRVSDLVSGFKAGANDYLTKPFASDELLARVSVHLELATISESYARFVPRQFLEQLGKERIIDVVLGDQVQRVMTVLFSDIRNFTRMSEAMSPAETFSFVNDYLGTMEPAISGHHGVIDKFVGDAVMALFPRSPDDAVHAAVDMIRRLKTWNAQRVDQPRSAVQIGIGLHTGTLMLGTVGASDRMDTTVISDAVNLASRVESLTKTYNIPLIITEDTYRALDEAGAFSVRRIDRVLVHGKSQPVVLYEVLDVEDSATRSAKLNSLPAIEASHALCEAGRFDAAVVRLTSALAVNPSDTVLTALLDRARGLASAATPQT